MDASGLLETSPHAIFVVNFDTRVRYVNRAGMQLLGVTDRRDILGAPLLELVHPVHRPYAQRQIIDVVTGRVEGPVRLRAVNDRWVAVRAAPTPDGTEVQLAIVDVTDRHRDEERLLHMATHDSLTELPGRALMLERLQLALAGRRSTDQLVAVLFVDLDGFKLINDALGHAAGDHVLCACAERLRAAVRPGDLVGRFGGDEFLIIGHVATADNAAALAARVEAAMGQPVPIDDDEVLVSASVGVALAPAGSGTAADQLINEADAAMYRAKELGKRRFEIFDEAMRERARDRSRIKGLLHRAVAEGRVVTHYQPVVDLRSRATVGFEALMRIRDDDGELLMPADFLDIATDAGLLPALDIVVLQEAAEQVQAWNETYDATLELSVNVCAAQIDDRFPQQVEEALKHAGYPPDLLLLEVTEQTLIERVPEVAGFVQRISDAGVRWAIDDFGTGWASLTYLRRFPVSIVKVDQSFVAGMPDHPSDEIIVEAIVGMARQLRLGCTVEGVETEAQYDKVVALDPPFGQGYLFGRPGPPEDVPAMLDTIGIAQTAKR